jgi:hypothetical protein
MDHNRGVKVTITDEGKEMIQNIILGCIKIIVTSVLTKENLDIIKKD